MYLTKGSLLQYIREYHDKSWTTADVDRLIREKKLRARCFGKEELFRQSDIEAYFSKKKKRKNGAERRHSKVA